METNIEQAVIGSLLYKPSFIQEVAEIIDEDDFKVNLYRHAFKTIRSMNEKKLEIELNSLYLEMGRPENVSMLAKSLDDVIFDPPYYARILRKRNLEDEIKQEASERNYEATQEKIKELQSLGKPVSLSDIQRMIEEREEFREVFKTGYSDLDHYVKLRPTDLMVIAGRPGVGKTAFGTAILGYMAQDYTIGLISLEMSLNAIGQRLCQMYSMEKLNQINKNFQDCSPSFFSMIEVRRAIKEFKEKNDAKVIMVDYLQLMESGRKHESRRLEVTSIIRGLKELAKEFQVAMIVISSLSRGQDGSDNSRPHMGLLRESGDIEYAADIILFLHHKKGEELTELILDKNRHGKAKKIINLVWLEDRIMYGNHDHRERELPYKDD